MLKEFKAFIMRGNVMDLAVGVILATTFGKIVTSLVNDIIMPAVGLLLGGVDFTSLSVVLREAQGEKGALTLNYGMFIQAVVDFLIIAMVIFVVVKVMNKISRKKEEKKEEVPPKSTQEELLTEIRDLLKK